MAELVPAIHKPGFGAAPTVLGRQASGLRTLPDRDFSNSAV
jgi:hypothetical protein